MFALLLLFGLSGHAETILVPSDTSAVREYEARRQANGYITPSAAYARQFPKPAAREHLLALYSQAHKAFLENTKAEAQRLYGEVVQLTRTEDWSKGDREILLLAYLRLAQIDSANRDAWLLEAVQLGPGLETDTSLFPPPLWERFARMRAEAPRLRPVKVLAYGEWTELLINGMSCTRAKCPEFASTPRPVRVTFVSNRWLPQTLTLSLSEIERASPPRQPLLIGSCGNPQFHPGTEWMQDKLPFWSLECEGKRNEIKRPVPGEAATLPVLALPEEPRPARKSWLESKWFWAGVGVIATAMIIENNRPRREERVPTTTY